MSLWTDLESAGQKVETFLENLVTGASKIKTVVTSLSGPTLAVGTALLNDAIKAVASGEGVITDSASGNVVGAISLSAGTVSLVKQLVADAKAGEKSIVADFEALNIKL